MTLQDWGALGEVIGGGAIIISLIYVGLQVRQGTKATLAATNQAFSRQYSDLILQLAQPDVADVFWRGLKGLDHLEEGEQAAFMAIMASIVRTYETFYFERQEGRFESRMYEGYQLQLLDTFGNTGVQEYWALRKHQFSSEFVSYIDGRLESYTVKQMYAGHR